MFTGFPVVINKSKILSLRDFKDIQIGDSMEDVEAIDNIVTLYKREIFEKFNFTPIAFENLKKFGTPITTIHYLKDGILAFEYTMTEEQKVLVSGITYYEDYIIKTFDGELTSHKIKDIDLPAA